MYAKLADQLAGLHHHIQQMGHRRALITADIRHTRLQQGLGNGQNALTMKFLALT